MDKKVKKTGLNKRDEGRINVEREYKFGTFPQVLECDVLFFC